MTYVDLKARVLVAQNCVRDLAVTDGGAMSAVVDGEHGSYEVRRRPSGCWSCTCEAWYWRLKCSHQRAVERLVAARLEASARQQGRAAARKET